jgi:hypothetical protein
MITGQCFFLIRILPFSVTSVSSVAILGFGEPHAGKLFDVPGKFEGQEDR